MNYIWGVMLLIGIAYGTLTGNAGTVSEAMLSSAKEAVTLCLAMCGVMGLWSGLMEIARDEGLVAAVSNRLRPVLRFLFPGIPRDHPALEHIATCYVANMLGLGSASTVYGLRAMELLGELNQENHRNTGDLPSTASNEMCTFLILNISSLQLIPVNIIAYRSQYGSVNPTAIVGPGIVATAVSTGVAVVFCKVMDRKRRA